ncbi:NADH-dependent flavin oxidoreductase [Paenibacillus polymyxa]|uniref:NADH-dependent flavin oxidoreductase n=1 Tax=Paenibacillus polymyxa TaxID=1406 RepID=UPI001BECADCB|nr:NADH-dependent flavin oxidoreductase [Paenibacillus polymyxa]MBT2282935.1 NADH-dependent flavin oxidoreductase [Paenibacillus polymyxa]
MNPKFNQMFEQVSLPTGITLKNRIVLAPMTHMSSNADGTISDAELAYYARRTGGAGMSITAVGHVTETGIGFPAQFGVYDDRFIPGLKKLADTMKQQGSVAVLQIFHAGRLTPEQAVPVGQVVAPSAVASERPGSPEPRELTDTEITSIIKDFGEATRRAIEAGFDGVEIHGANGYLIQQFFSPHSNRREDRWGGSTQKRLTFPLAVVDEIQKVVAEHTKLPFIIGYRFSPEEPETPGLTMEDTYALVDVLKDKKLDYLHVSLNEFWSKPRRGEADTRSRMEFILDRVNGKLPVIGVGSIHTADQAAEALQTGVPLLAIGRELIIEPDWVEKIESGREEDIETILTKSDQERLVIPDGLWNAIIHTPGWFPMAEDK